MPTRYQAPLDYVIFIYHILKIYVALTTCRHQHYYILAYSLYDWTLEFSYMRIEVIFAAFNKL